MHSYQAIAEHIAEPGQRLPGGIKLSPLAEACLFPERWRGTATHPGLGLELLNGAQAARWRHWQACMAELEPEDCREISNSLELADNHLGTKTLYRLRQASADEMVACFSRLEIEAGQLAGRVAILRSFGDSESTADPVVSVTPNPKFL